MYENVLREIGLTGNEIKVYLALLDLGYTKTGEIIKKTKIHTSKVYDALERLIQKGIVTYSIEGKVKHFSAVDPSRLNTYLEEKKKKIEEEQKMLNAIIPKLRTKKLGEEAKAEIFRGYNGVKTAFEDILKTLKRGDETLAFILKGQTEQVTRFFDNFHLKREERGIRGRIIVSEDLKERMIILKKFRLMKVRKINRNFATPASFNVYSNKILIFLGLEKEPMIFLITNKDIANSFRNYFEIIWGMSKNV